MIVTQSKFLRVFAILFLTIGIATSLTTVITSKIKYCETALAEIVEMEIVPTAESSYITITYKFEVLGKSYNAYMDINSNKWNQQVGKFENIKYNPNNPTEIEDKNKTKACIFVTVFYGIMFITFIIGLYIDYRNKRREKYNEY